MSDSSSSAASTPPGTPSGNETPENSTATAVITETPPSNSSQSKAEAAIESLSCILSSIPPSISSSQYTSFTLLHDPDISSQISTLLRHPDSGAGDNNLCRWLYDTFQSSEPTLQLVVLRFLPIIAGLYMSRVHLRKPLAGFEAVLLALYAHETTSRGGQSVTVNVPDISHPSIYHDTKMPTSNNSTDFKLAVISPSLEPHGTMRSTRRAKIVGVCLELYYRSISRMPVRSKIDFCEFCEMWAGQDGDVYKDDGDVEEGGDDGTGHKEKAAGSKEGGIPLPWELLQPVLRILGHCLLGADSKHSSELFEAACAATRSLYARALHDVDPRAILATGSLLRLGKMAFDPKNGVDHTEIPMTNVISL